MLRFDDHVYRLGHLNEGKEVSSRNSLQGYCPLTTTSYYLSPTTYSLLPLRWAAAPVLKCISTYVRIRHHP